ncbi:RICIN domain-containing protein [Micromonospora olivasterospora]|uniref:RICIN domain-containing protein n=1 Tax=Micromonospora olivasterospora TaxID=1880 RepID=UPI0014783333|nr:RICIN domain-containing protein [Micromonospora olivasterospora]
MAASLTVIAPTPAYAATPIVEIVNYNSGLRADVMWASTSPLTGVFLWPNNSSPSQEFEMLDSGGGFFRLKARHSGQCLMLDWRVGTQNGTPIIQDPYCDAGYRRAEWYRQYITPPQPPCYCFPATYMIIRNRSTGRCLDAASGTGQPGQQAILQQWDCIVSGTEWNRWNQVWTINTLNAPPIG